MERQTTVGKVWDFVMSPDGFVAGPNHAMDWMSGISPIPGLVEEYAETTGAVLFLGDGFRLVDSPGGTPIRRDLFNGEELAAAVRDRYHPNRRGQQ